MAECNKCVCESVCRFNDGHNLYCKQDYECPHFCQVVRCEECEYSKLLKDNENQNHIFRHCRMMNAFVKDNSFCSYGTPKERGGEK